MASKYLQKYPVPAGFQQILADFTRQVLRDQPPNIIEYAAKYFQMLEKGDKFQFNSKYNVNKDDKKYELNYNPKNAEDITKKATSIATRVQDTGRPTKGGANANVGPKKESKDNKGPGGDQGMINLPPELVNEINKVFDQVDVNKNGFIQSNEIRKAVQYIAQQSGVTEKVSEAEINQFIQLVDSNNDGKVSRKQFINFLASMLGPLIGEIEAFVAGTQKTVNQQQVQNYMNEQDQQVMYNELKQQADQIFNEIDVDGNNYISLKEMRKAVQTHFGQVDPELFNQFFQVADQDDDGKVSREELFEFLVKLSNQM